MFNQNLLEKKYLSYHNILFYLIKAFQKIYNLPISINQQKKSKKYAKCKDFQFSVNLHNDIMNLEDGYNAKLGESGLNFSGG